MLQVRGSLCPFNIIITDTLKHRIRHLKCGEEKPACLRCIRSGTRCEYFIQFATVDATSTVLIKPLLSPPPSGRDSRGFEYFRHNTLSGLMGFAYNSDFWNQTVLQFCETSPAVLHAVLSLSALHENVLNETRADKASSGDLVFLKQYNKSIKFLHSCQQHQAVSSTLICCVLFICLENFSGNYDKALAHLQSGLSILENWRKEDLKSASEIKVRENLTQVFRRLDMQATTFMNSRQPLINATTFSDHFSENDGPTLASFSSLQQAQEELDRIVIRLVYVLTLKSPAKHSTTKTLLLQGLSARFRAWKKAFDAFSVQESQNMDTKDLRLSVMLGLHFQTAILMLEVKANPVLQEQDTDAKFMRIINLSRSLIQSGASPKPSYASEMGVIAPLYFTSMSASPYLRQQAIALLRTVKGKEGPWDPRTTSRIAEEVMIAERINKPGVPLSGGVQFLAAAHNIPC
jgi:Fungal specific transcription factor domain/Fungal Zn(2)-Cys(6) binuclear cluster domain